ncbi:MAG: winged helix-turn-helix domain-containing protein [Actinobacteria bacterium]|nr:winged helix-turn-helix domain-containing protein [Actinomycetota bacterium]
MGLTPIAAKIAAVEFRILGRMEVVDGDEDLTPPRPKQRALLALLLLRAGELVTADEAAETLWEGRPPPSARNAIHGHVAALRKLLGRDRIETHDGGYVLRLEEDELDLHRFERLLTSARGRPAGEQAGLLTEALALLRGAPLEDFRYESFAAAEAARIDELRLLAVESRIDADLALGRHEQVVPELERLVGEAPLRERLRGQLLLALYRSGRQADALAAYGRTRDKLLDELGLEPGPALQALERQILNQDFRLDLDQGRSPGAIIPTPPTPLLGREAELAEARNLLLRNDVRVVTLTGPGGTGKTRLALEAARAAAPHFPGGTFFASLGDLTDAELVLPAIARAVGVGEGGGPPLEESLAARLADRPVLLLLDNVEHVVAAAPMLGRLLAAAPALTVLVTSREPLRLYGEHLYRVPPLDPVTAAALFLDRARAVRADLADDESTQSTVAEICRRLDGLPLAIELAAARMDLFSPKALLARLGQALELLTDGPVDRPERQQTLRATLEWSYERLATEEQELFRRLAVFAGSWTIEAAEAVCGDRVDIVAGLSSLLDKSLLQLISGDGEPRQAMLETLRDGARERLQQTTEIDELQRRHLAHYLAVAEEAEPSLRGAPGARLDRLELEHANFRAALDRADDIGENEKAQRLAGALWRFWYLRGHLSEGRQRLERALGADARPTSARGKVLLGAAVMAINTSDPETARLRSEESLALHRELADAWGEAYSGFMLGNVTDDRAEAAELYESSIRVFRELGDEHSALLATRHLAGARAELGDVDRARALHEDNLARARASGNERIEASTLGALAEHALRDDRFEEASSLLEKSLALHAELGDVLDTAVDLCRFAAVLAPAGEATTALVLLAAVEALGDAVGDRRSLVASLNEKTLSQIRARLEDAAFSESWAQGLTLTLNEAVALALRRSA